MSNSRLGLVGSLLLSKETASRQLIEGIRIIATSIAAAVSAARTSRTRPFAGGRRLPSATAGGQDRWRLEGSLI
jgi:hypothetical protein